MTFADEFIIFKLKNGSLQGRVLNLSVCKAVRLTC